MAENMNYFKLKLAYLGYKGINIENVSLKTFKNFISVMPNRNNESSKLLVGLPSLSLGEVEN